MVTNAEQDLWNAHAIPGHRIEELLHGPLPAWEVAPNQTVTCANLLALWLWELLPPGFPAEDIDLHGLKTTEVFARNAHRIPDTIRNCSFWMTKFKILYHLSGDDSFPLADVPQATERLGGIWTAVLQDPSIDGIDTYALDILPPSASSKSLPLSFHTSIARLADANGQPEGYLAVYQPNIFSETYQTAYDTIDQKYKELLKSGQAYVQVLTDKEEKPREDLKEVQNYTPVAGPETINRPEQATGTTRIIGLLEGVAEAPQYRRAVALFGAAYQHRKQFPWLEESGKLPAQNEQDTVVYALSEALATYIPPDRLDETKQLDVDAMIETPFRWGRAVKEAAARLPHCGSGLDTFAAKLNAVGIDAITSDADVLKRHIAQAFDDYYADRESGTGSPDPW